MWPVVVQTMSYFVEIQPLLFEEFSPLNEFPFEYTRN